MTAQNDVCRVFKLEVCAAAPLLVGSHKRSMQACLGLHDYLRLSEIKTMLTADSEAWSALLHAALVSPPG